MHNKHDCQDQASCRSRSQVKAADTWDLASLFADDAAWEAAFTQWETDIAGYDEFRGKLGDDAKTLAPA